MNISGQSISQQFIALLTLCQQLQSEKDGARSPEPDKAAVGVSEAFDDFARQIQHTCLFASMTDSLLAQQSRLSDTGRQLEPQGLTTSTSAITTRWPLSPAFNDLRVR